MYIDKIFSCPCWTITALSALPHRRDAPFPFTSLWPCVGLYPVCPCLPEEPRTVRSTPGVASATLCTEEESPPLSTLLNAAHFIMGTLLVYALPCYPVWLPGPSLPNYFWARRPPNVQDSALLLVELTEISTSPHSATPQVPVQGSMTPLWCHSYSSQFSLQTFCLVIQIFNEQGKEDQILY